MTYRQFKDDIAVALGMTHDDALWGDETILSSIVLCENRLVSQDLKEDLGVAADGRAAQDKITTNTFPVTFNATPDDILWAHHWFDLSAPIHDLGHGKGVGFVRYHIPSIPQNCPPSVAKATFTQTTLASLTAIYGSTYQHPSPSQPYFCRSGDSKYGRVYIFGMDPAIKKLLVGLYVAADYILLDPDSELKLRPAMQSILKQMVLDMLVWPMQIPQERLKNDGRDMEPGQVVHTRPALGVNHPSMIEKP